ncbi:MAG: saccharopine dehydrogenase NADP-binding domain-containing protein [Candidatus Thorarchaeota archaeon]|nr:saccharopine dehydrogenase NADP-binding domain-containing protein [Candidatus Thorarchaeota archaeon]
MKIGIIGSGQMGRGAAFDLAKQDSVDEILLADIDLQNAEALAKEVGPKAKAEKVDAKNRSQLVKFFNKVDSVISAVSYTVNVLHTEVAIETQTHLCDLGGGWVIVEKQLEMNEAAKTANVTIVPDCGLAPGMVSVLARHGIEYLDKVDSVKIRVGGLQQEPRPPLNYSLIFSVEGLINEYVEPCIALRNGKIVKEEPLIGFEEITFPEPYGKLEAFNTSGGTSTLPQTYLGKVDELDYKTIRYPGHGHKMWTLLKLGLMDSKSIEVDGSKIAPRRVLETLLEKNLPPSGKDVTLIRVMVEGWKGTESRIVEYEVIDLFDEKTGLTSMMRTTSFPAAVTAIMMADGRIENRGVLTPERCIPPGPFIEELRERGIDIKQRIV